jgi:hypothetical protein
MSEETAALNMRGVWKAFQAENAPVAALRGVDLARPRSRRLCGNYAVAPGAGAMSRPQYRQTRA